MKMLVEIFNTYGKSDSESRSDLFVIEDTPESREELIAYSFWGREDLFENEIENFVNGKTDNFYGDLTGGDWDDPTGRYIQLSSKEDYIFGLLTQYQKEKNEIELLFEKDK